MDNNNGNKINDLYFKIDDLESLVDEKDKIINEKNNELKKQQEKINNLRERRVVDIDLYDELINKYEIIEQKYNDIEQKYKFLQNENYDLRKQNNNLFTIIDKKDDENEKLKKYQNDYEKLNETYLLLNKELIKSEQIINNDREKMNDYDEIIKTLETQIIQLKECQEINIKKNISFNYSFDSSISEIIQNIKIPEKGETVADIKINALENDIRELVANKQELQNKLSSIENEKILLKNIENEMKNVINSMQKEIDEKNDKYKKQNDILLAQKNYIDKLKNLINNELNKIKLSFKLLKENYEIFMEQFESEINDNYKKIINKFNEQIQTIQLLSHFKHTLEIKLDTICNDNQKTLKESDKLKLINENLQNEINKLNEQLKIYENKLLNYKNINDNNNNCKCEELKKELSTLKTINQNNQEKLSQLQNVYHLERQSFLAERKTKERLLNENIKYEKEIQKLQKQIKQQQYNNENTDNNNNDNVVKNNVETVSNNNNVDNDKKNNNNLKFKRGETFVITFTANKKQQIPSKTTTSGIKFEMADEIGEFMDPNQIEIKSQQQQQQQQQLAPQPTPFPKERIKTLRERNLLLKPHLRTSYPVELQNIKMDEKILQTSSLSSSASTKNSEQSKKFMKKSSSEKINEIPIKRSKL